MENSLRVRKAGHRDIPRILELLVQVNHVHAVARPDLFVDGKRKYEAKDLRKILKDYNRPIFVCTEKGRVLGYCMTAVVRTRKGRCLTDRTDLYIDDICVDEEVRGKGIGTALYEYVKDFAVSIGCYSMTLHVWDCNPGAREFYEKVGMRSYMTAMETILPQRKFGEGE